MGNVVLKREGDPSGLVNRTHCFFAIKGGASSESVDSNGRALCRMLDGSMTWSRSGEQTLIKSKVE